MTTYKYIKQIGPGFYQIRAPFKFLFGLVDIGTHMSIAKLNSGKFLVIDTVKLEPDLKAELDDLTENGALIDSVVATHPFHTIYFPDFYEQYKEPHIKYYGTPRHLKVQPEIPWVGDVNCEKVRNLWNENGVEMRIPDGGEFVDPQPPRTNHFNNVFVFHRASKTVFNDDNICVSNDPGFLLRLFGMKDGHLNFHMSINGPGLYPTKEAPFLYKQWVQKMLNDWDFENLVTAHNGNKIGGAKEAVQALLDRSESLFQKISDRNARKEPIDQKQGGWTKDSRDDVNCG